MTTPTLTAALLTLAIFATLTSAAQPSVDDKALARTISKLEANLEKLSTTPDCEDVRKYAKEMFTEAIDFYTYRSQKRVSEKERREDKSFRNSLDHIYKVIQTELSKEEQILLGFLITIYALALILLVMLVTAALTVIWDILNYIIFGPPPPKPTRRVRVVRLVKVPKKGGYYPKTGSDRVNILAAGPNLV